MRAAGTRARAASVRVAGIRGDSEAEAIEPTDRMILDQHLALIADRHRQRRHIGADLAHQHGGALVDETLRQRGVERVRQPLLDFARAFRPMRRIGEPVGAVRDIGPAARRGDPSGECFDIALHIVEPRDLGGEPVVRNVASSFRQMLEQPRHEPGMRIDAELAKIGQAARRP